MRAVVLEPEEERARQVLEALKAVRHLTDEELAPSLGISRSSMAARRNGTTKMGLPDIVRLAGPLGVRPEVFLMDPDDALRWVLDNKPQSAAAAQPNKSMKLSAFPLPMAA